jgi:SpoVK/Ycf46/Vps4 family AAA+-type ATPase
MTGLGRVKEEIRRKTRYLEVERGRREQGLSNQPPRLHLVFQGNPGTGKTTVARLIGEIYRDLGLLQRGHVVEVGGRELVAGYVGQTATKTNDIIDDAIDGVLFIDEAYTLHQEGNNNFGQEAIETLLQRMENERERLAVIIAGYPDLMDGFIQSNPGLSERFTTTVSFDDYTPEELLTIFYKQLSRVRGSISPNLETTLPSLLSQCYENRDKNFGNARFVENLFNKMDESRSLRVVENNLDRLNEPFQAEDIPEGYQFNHQEQQEDLTAVLQELNQLTGLESVKENVQEIVDEQLANQRLQEKESGKTGEVVTRHFLFTGNPGTGKTTVARLLGRIFRAMGLLRKGHFQEVNRNNLVAEYIGQTAPKTQKAIDSALDGVLFIDEAYALSSGGERDFGQEAINTLVPAMENQRERLVVILAGYSQEMKDLISSNSGLQSRISDEIHFPDYNAEELHSIFLNLCQQDGRICPPEVQQHLQQFLQTMYNNRDQNFGNGRDVRNVYEKMVKKQKKRLVRDSLSGEAMMSFAPEDIP